LVLDDGDDESAHAPVSFRTGDISLDGFRSSSSPSLLSNGNANHTPRGGAPATGGSGGTLTSPNGNITRSVTISVGPHVGIAPPSPSPRGRGRSISHIGGGQQRRFPSSANTLAFGSPPPSSSSNHPSSSSILSPPSQHHNSTPTAAAAVVSSPTTVPRRSSSAAHLTFDD
jgi:hypothetical protein